MQHSQSVIQPVGGICTYKCQFETEKKTTKIYLVSSQSKISFKIVVLLSKQSDIKNYVTSLNISYSVYKQLQIITYFKRLIFTHHQINKTIVQQQTQRLFTIQIFNANELFEYFEFYGFRLIFLKSVRLLPQTCFGSPCVELGSGQVRVSPDTIFVLRFDFGFA